MTIPLLFCTYLSFQLYPSLIFIISLCIATWPLSPLKKQNTHKSNLNAKWFSLLCCAILNSYDVISKGTKDSKWLPSVWLMLFYSFIFHEKKCNKKKNKLGYGKLIVKKMLKNDNTNKWAYELHYLFPFTMLFVH